MNYWLTTHWPPREDKPDRFENTGAWVADGKQAVLSEMQPGDMLFIYESKSGKTTIEMTADGKETRVRRIRGKGGVTALAEIDTKATEVEGSGYENYTDRSKTWWRYKADASVINSNGFVGRRSVAKILGYEETYSFRGFGKQSSGVKQLSKDEYEKLHSAFLASKEKNDTALERKRWSGGSGVGGEGPLHKSLKEFIAARPEEALKEAGLRTIQVEYPFATGDRIDIVLEDKDGRLVTVEVEIDCDDTELAGPLQCMKYRALIAYQCERRVDEVRTVLAARSVSSAVKKRCQNYEVQVMEIPKWPNLAPLLNPSPLPN